MALEHTDDIVGVEEAKAELAAETTETTETAATATPVARPWYVRIGEDWWATVVGLALVVLVVLRVFHAIP